MEGFAAVIGFSVMIVLGVLFALALTYLMVTFAMKVVLRRCHELYKSVSVYYYMGVCEKYGRAGLKREVEKTKSGN